MSSPYTGRERLQTSSGGFYPPPLPRQSKLCKNPSSDRVNDSFKVKSSNYVNAKHPSLDFSQITKHFKGKLLVGVGPITAYDRISIPKTVHLGPHQI